MNASTTEGVMMFTNATIENITVTTTAAMPDPRDILIMQCFMMESPSDKSECLLDLLLEKIPPKDPESQQLEDAAAVIMRYVSPVIILLGLCMNLLTFLVLTMTKMWTMSSSVYLAAICVSDTLNLMITLMRFWIIEMWNIDFRNSHVVLCKAGAFLAYYLAHISAWLLVAVSLERVLMVGWPLQVKRLCTHRNAWIAVGVILLLFLLLNGHLFWLQGPFRTHPIKELEQIIFLDHECYTHHYR
ncbi:unnamed protein product [Owenia fusiformis]|uniref:Uncharacterized protein n=1 Tax=Owenia fusiformis TaxID=6347 RepID=A0A8J1XRU0_OWEFU|nr:unnamed protein product [Owenia fusiformis]